MPHNTHHCSALITHFSILINMNLFSVIIFLVSAIAAVSTKSLDLAASGKLNKSNESPYDEPTRIVNGSHAAVGQFPHQVSLLKIKTGTHFCGASIITNRWLLTAAHCTINQKPFETLIAVVGTVDLSTGGVRYQLSAYVQHPNYRQNQYGWDISLARTDKSIEFNDLIQPIALPTTNTPPYVPVIISGWGYVSSSNQTAPNHLRYLKSQTISSKACKNRIPSIHEDLDALLCHLTYYGGACYGDSGEILPYLLLLRLASRNLRNFLIVSC